MARIRSIKPEFWQDSRMASQTALVRLVFLCLWSMADDEGRLEGDALAVWRFGSFREDSREVASALETLRGLARVVLYEVEGNPYIQIVKFTKHQRIDHASKSKYPAYTKGCDLLQESSREIRESSRIVAPDLEQGAGSRDQGSKNNVGLAPDAANGKKKEFAKQAVGVIEFLNDKAGKNYQPVKQNVDLIVSLLGQGVTVDDLRAVVAKKCREWKGKPDMELYLRPATLFGPKNFFQKYGGEIPPAEPQ